MHNTSTLTYCLPTSAQPSVQDMGGNFAPSVGYYLPPRYCLSPVPPLTPPLVTAQLENKELWEKFHSVGTEMILTKNGRRMFPEFSASLSGLEPHSVYSLCVQAVPEGEHRYKWRAGVWSKSGRAEPGPPTHLYLHPESPAPGHRWMERSVCFSKIRLTNNTLSQGGQIVLQSMHRYSLRLYIIPASSAGSSPRHVTSVSFPETSFIAVTSYQNPKLSMLKIEENPFAKGIKYFKNQHESHMPRKRIGRPEESGDGGSERKKVKEGVESPARDQRTEESQPIPEESAEGRGAKEESAGGRGAKEESAEGRGAKEESAEGRGAKEESAEGRGAKEESAEGRGAKEESAEGRGAKEESAEGRGAKEESAEEGERRPPAIETTETARAAEDGLEWGRDITSDEREREDRAQRTDMIVHWGPLPHRATWLPPPAVSPLAVTPYTPSRLMAHRLTQPVPSGLALFPPPMAALPPFTPATPYCAGPWHPAPVPLSQPHPQLLQQMCVSPWYPSPHSASGGL